MKIRFYHGTSDKVLPKILKQGLRPRCCSETEAKVRRTLKSDIPNLLRNKLDQRCDLRSGFDPIYMTTCKENAQGYAEFISRGTPWGDCDVGIRGEGEACSFLACDINNLERSCSDILKDEPHNMACLEFMSWFEMITDSGALRNCAMQDKPNPVVLQFDIDVDDEDLDKMTRMTARDILYGEYERPDCKVVNDVLQCEGRIDEFSGSRYAGVVLPDKIQVIE